MEEKSIKKPTYRIGVDLGGTKIEAILLGANGDEIARERIPTPNYDYQATLQAVAGLVRKLEQRFNLTASVGVGIPGTLSRATGLVKNANSTRLIGKPLDQDLSSLLERPIRLQNDANCFAISEATDGAVADAESVFGVILGTGAGAGIVFNGQIVDGPNGIGGEWGHNPLPWPTDEERPGPLCYCGKQGCVETFLSGPGMAARFKEVSGRALSPGEIEAAALAGDADCRAYLELFLDRLARGLATVINVLDPEVIVLGGGLSNLRSPYEELPKLWGKYVFSDRVDTAIRPPVHGDSSGVRGAAWLWPKDN